MYIRLPQGKGDMLVHKYVIWGANGNRWKKNGWEAKRTAEGRKKKMDVSPKDRFHACCLLLFPKPVFLHIITQVSHPLLPRTSLQFAMMCLALALETRASLAEMDTQPSPTGQDLAHTIQPAQSLGRKNLSVHIWDDLSPCLIIVFAFMTLWRVQPSFCWAGFPSLCHLYHLPGFVPSSCPILAWRLLTSTTEWIAISLDLCQTSL